MIFRFVLIFGIFFASIAFSGPRTVFVQLFEWRWPDIALECERYLGPNGFSAVQVSPPQEHLLLPQGPWWVRYQPVSYRLESRGGTEQEFRQMVARCKRAGVDVYTDAVINHMTAYASGLGSAGTRFAKYEYTGLYSYGDFHHCGRNGNDKIVNFQDRYELQHCELLGLADLDTGSPRVQRQIAGYLNRLLAIGVAGFRLDAVKHVSAEDIRGIMRNVRGSPYIVQEIVPGEAQPAYREYLDIGDVNVFEYAFALARAARDGGVEGLLRSIPHLPDSRDAVVFVENHDLQRLGREQYRLLSHRDDPELYFLAEAFLLTWPYGYPQLFSGFDFSGFDQGPPPGSALDSSGNCRAGWTCEHRVPGIAELVRFRNATDSRFFAAHAWTDGSSQIAFSRGELGFVAINFGGKPMQRRLRTSLAPGTYCNLLERRYYPEKKLSTCAAPVRVEHDGTIQVNLPGKKALVLQ